MKRINLKFVILIISILSFHCSIVSAQNVNVTIPSSATQYQEITIPVQELSSNAYIRSVTMTAGRIEYGYNSSSKTIKVRFYDSGSVNVNVSVQYALHVTDPVSGAETAIPMVKNFPKTVNIASSYPSINRMWGSNNPGVGSGQGYSIDPDYSTTYMNYQWKITPIAGLDITSGTTSRSFMARFHQEGIYFLVCTVTDKANGRSSSISKEITVDYNGPIVRSLNAESEFSFSGNNRQYTVTPNIINGENIKYEVYNLYTGELVKRGYLDDLGGTIDFDSLNKGLYIISIYTNEINRETYKISIK